VRVFDNLAPQVHGPGQRLPEYLHPDVELMVGDIQDTQAIERALDERYAVYHFAASVGARKHRSASRNASAGSNAVAGLFSILIDNATIATTDLGSIGSSQTLRGQSYFLREKGKTLELSEG